jgi:hypothetical protein
MAELPRYQPTGYLPADTPRLDLANVKESINLNKGISNSLDRLSDFAFKEAAEKAQREGMQYGAENMPGIEQVILAKEQGQDINTLFPKAGTFFGDAARKVQGAQLRIQLESKGREDLARISAALDVNQIDLKEAQLQIKAMTDGFGRTLSQLSPEDGLRFRASMATVANDTYKKAVEKTTQIYQEGLKSNADGLLASTATLMKDSISLEQDPVLLSEKIGIERQRVFDIASATGDPKFVAEKMAEFETKRLSAIVDYVSSSSFAKTPMEGIRRIQNKDFGNLTEVMRTVDMDKLQKRYIERAGETAVMWKRSSELKAAENIDLVNNIKDDIYSGKISGQVGYGRIKALGVSLPDEERKAFLNGDFAGASPQVYGEFESMADKGNLGEGVIDTYAKSGVISWKQANSLKKIARGNEQDMSRSRQFVQNSLGIPDITMPGYGAEKKRVAEINTQLAKEKQEALNQGLPFNAMDRAMELVSDKTTQLITEGKKTSRERLRKKLEEAGVAYKEDYTEETLKAAGIKSQDVRKSILRTQREVTQ